MDQITLNSDLCCDALVIPGTALEKCLREANESQLKIYLYLLKNGSSNPTVSSIADYFNYSEQDVKRALRFWNAKEKTRTAKDRGEGNIVEFSQRPVYSKEKVAELTSQQDVSQLLFIVEQYMKRPIRQDEVMSILYIYDGLAFPADLVEYLVEYCISNNKKSFRNIEEVAREWKDAGVQTHEDAKRLTRNVPKEMKTVMEELGFPKDHQPTEVEIAYVRKWTGRYGYGIDIIKEACRRTVLAICKPSIRYADGILKQWHEANVVKLEDIIEVDREFQQKKMNETCGTSGKGGAKKPAAGKFKNFNERKIDYNALMDEALKN